MEEESHINLARFPRCALGRPGPHIDGNSTQKNHDDRKPCSKKAPHGREHFRSVGEVGNEGRATNRQREGPACKQRLCKQKGHNGAEKIRDEHGKRVWICKHAEVIAEVITVLCCDIEAMCSDGREQKDEDDESSYKEECKQSAAYQPGCAAD